jgi:Tfp pilus assembly protein PilO
MKIPLKNQLAHCEKAQWTLGVLLAIGLGVFFVIAYRPANLKLDELVLQIQSRQRAMNDNRVKAQDLPNLAAQVQRFESQLRFYDRQLPRQPAMDQFIKDLTGISQELALKNWKFSPRAPVRDSTHFELPIQIDFTGDFLTSAAFVRRVEDLQRLTRVKNLAVKSKNIDGATVDVTLVVSIYFVEG